MISFSFQMNFWKLGPSSGLLYPSPLISIFMSYTSCLTFQNFLSLISLAISTSLQIPLAQFFLQQRRMVVHPCQQQSLSMVQKSLGTIYTSQRSYTVMIFHYLVSLAGEGNGIPLQYSCLENPMGGGAWQAAIHGVTKSRT